jgi:hypothetical protein
MTDDIEIVSGGSGRCGQSSVIDRRAVCQAEGGIVAAPTHEENPMSRLLARALAALLSLNIAACSTLRDVPPSRERAISGAPAPTRGLRVGDEVRLTLISSVQTELVITAVEADALIGNPTDKSPSVRIAYDQIARIERREFDWLKTSLLTVGAVTLVAAYALSHIAFFPGPP